MEVKVVVLFVTGFVYLLLMQNCNAQRFVEKVAKNRSGLKHKDRTGLFDKNLKEIVKLEAPLSMMINSTKYIKFGTITTRNNQTKHKSHKVGSLDKQTPYKSHLNRRSKRESNMTSTNVTSIYDHILDDKEITNNTNCSNEYCISDEDYINMIDEYMFPTSYEWVLIVLHSFVFLIGLIGNALVCVAVYRNHSMRTVTNYFIVNLAVADFMVILFCLPPTVLWDITETWFLGEALCKIVPYLQTVSVTVSVLTLTFISADRWYAICFPLKFKSTTNRAKTGILLIWLVALVFDIPELVVLSTIKRLERVDTHYFVQCEASWTSDADTNWNVIKMIALYTFPLGFMSVAYFQIVRVLWQSDNIPGHMVNTGTLGLGTLLEIYLINMSIVAGVAQHFDGIYRTNTFTMNSNASTEGQLRSRRKAAKMLVAVVIMFAVCYFPVHLFSVMRITMKLPQNEINTALALLSHWMCYANSAVNPVIYNFMSGNFRREFRRAFAQCCHSTNTGSSYQLKSMSGRKMYSMSSTRPASQQSRRPLGTSTTTAAALPLDQKQTART